MRGSGFGTGWRVWTKQALLSGRGDPFFKCGRYKTQHATNRRCRRSCPGLCSSPPLPLPIKGLLDGGGGHNSQIIRTERVRQSSHCYYPSVFMMIIDDLRRHHHHQQMNETLSPISTEELLEPVIRRLRMRA